MDHHVGMTNLIIITELGLVYNMIGPWCALFKHYIDKVQRCNNARIIEIIIIIDFFYVIDRS